MGIIILIYCVKGHMYWEKEITLERKTKIKRSHHLKKEQNQKVLSVTSGY